MAAERPDFGTFKDIRLPFRKLQKSGNKYDIVPKGDRPYMQPRFACPSVPKGTLHDCSGLHFVR
jgi:hypothetical protein